MNRRDTILLFDVMGTLVHDPFYDEMPSFFDLSFPDLLQRLQPGPWVEFELGRRTEAEFLDDFFRDRRAFDKGAFVETVRRAYRWLPGMEALLSELRDRDCPMHAFSNYPVWYRMIEERLEVSRFASWTFVSCLIGFRKPDPAAYAHVIDVLGTVPEQCLFVDDRDVNCDAARAAGLRAVKFEGVDALREALREHGVVR